MIVTLPISRVTVSLATTLLLVIAHLHVADPNVQLGQFGHQLFCWLESLFLNGREDLGSALFHCTNYLRSAPQLHQLACKLTVHTASMFFVLKWRCPRRPQNFLRHRSQPRSNGVAIIYLINRTSTYFY